MINFDVSQVGDIMLDVMLVNNCSITHIFDILTCAFVLLHIYTHVLCLSLSILKRFIFVLIMSMWVGQSCAPE